MDGIRIFNFIIALSNKNTRYATTGGNPPQVDSEEIN
jgi:hypothetical protein